jgi:hypothetical protein
LFACHFLAIFTTWVSQKTLCKISLKCEKNIWGYDPYKSFSFGEFLENFAKKTRFLDWVLPNLEHLLPTYKSPNNKRITKENLVSYLLCNQIWLDHPFANVATPQKLFF